MPYDFPADTSKLQFSTPPEVLIPFDAASAAKSFGKKISADDLKIVEGIGPKIEDLLNGKSSLNGRAPI